MLDFIIMIVIIYVIYKKYNNSPSRIITLLKNKGFQNISIIKQNATNNWVTANLHGDNYLFEITKPGYNVTNTSIHTLGEYATKAHFHNIILIAENSVISSNAKSAISQYKIEIWNNAKLNEFSNQSQETAITSIIKTSEINDTCKIASSDDPIQDGKTANSIFSNLFHNKIEKL